MNNIQRQKWCNEQKWLTSEAKKSDQSGYMAWCDYCKYKQSENEKTPCMVNQLNKELNCLCATAYNKMVRKK